MRVGLYLGRHAGGGGGIAVYARSLTQHLVELLSDPRYQDVELVLYGEATILDVALLKELSLAEVLVSDSRGRWYRSASSYFRKLPNGARSRVLIRPLGETLGRHCSSVVDQILLPLLFWWDGIQLVHACANIGLLLSTRPQLITVHDLYQGWPCTAPVDQSPDSPASNELPTSRPNKIQRIYRIVFRAQCRIASFIVTDARHIADEIVSRFGFPRTKLRTLPLGLDRVFGEYVDAASKEASSNRTTSSEVSEREPGYILMFASNDPRKNLDKTLAAWAALPEEFNDRRLLVVTPDKRLKKKVLAFAKREAPGRPLECLKWLERADLPKLYADSAVILVPTLAEGFGLPAVEAYALGVPLVCGPVEYLADKSEVDGVYRCDPHCENSIASALAQALSGSPHTAVRASATTVRRMQDLAVDMLALYEEVGLRYGTNRRT